MAVFEKKVQLRSLLDETDLLTCTVESSKNVEGHTEYVIRVQRGPHPGKCWHVSKRFRDFDSLNGALSALTGVSLPLPPKKLIGNMDPLFIAERQTGLQKYLNFLLQNPFLQTSFLVRQFLDPDHYSPTLHEIALHSVSLALRGEPAWEVMHSLPELGWRARKHYFAIKKHSPHQEYHELLLTLTDYGPDMNLPVSQLQSVLTYLSTFVDQFAVKMHFFRCTEAGCLVVREYVEEGSFRDALCGSKVRIPALRKYAFPKQYNTIQGRMLVTYAHQILQNLVLLHGKGIPYGQLHTGNLCIQNGRVHLLEIEGGVLGLPGFYRPFALQHRRLDSILAFDMYCFGRVLYEMAFGRPLQTSTLESFPSCPADLGDLLQKLLSPQALREGLPSAQQMLQHSFFDDMGPYKAERCKKLPPVHIREALKVIMDKVEERMRHDQKIVYQQRRHAKIQEMLSSEEEQKRRKQKWKEKEKERQQQQRLQKKPITNGKSPERSDSPASTSTATSAGTLTPPYNGKNDGRPPASSNFAPSPPTPAPTSVGVPAAPQPPPVPLLPSSSVVPERSALLTSISAFDKSNLRHVSNPR